MTIHNTVIPLIVEIVARSVPAASALYVVVRLSTSCGQSAEAVFDLLGLIDDPRSLYKLAAKVGFVALRPATKVALAESLERAVATAKTTELPTFIPAVKPGWIGDAYVTPQRVYGDPDGRVRPLLTDVPLSLNGFSEGSIRYWRTVVGEMLAGNPLLIFYVCAALMAPLLKVMGWKEGCGFLLVGQTRCGKTTVGHLGGSVCGGGDSSHPHLVHSLRVARNGLEPDAPFANDRALFLDDAQDLPGNDGEKSIVLRDMIHMLHRGRGKGRMGYGQPAEWQSVFFMAHNQTLRQTMSDGRQRHNKAAEVRLPEIPCDRRYGAFDDIHQMNSASDFADALRRRAEMFYGAPMDVFLTEVTRQVAIDREGLKKWLQGRIDSMREQYLGLSDSDYAVGKFFCLAYAAGRFAEEYCNILPMSANEIRDAVVDVYQSHRRHVGAPLKSVAPIDTLKQYIEKNLSAFTDQRDKLKKDPVRDGAVGYITNESERKEFTFTREQFSRAVAPRLVEHVCPELKNAGLLIHDGRHAAKEDRGSPVREWNQTKRVIGGKRRFHYCVSAQILD